MVDLGSQVEPRSVLAIEGNEIAPKHHVVADENAQPRAKLYGHGTVIGRSNAQRRHAIRCILIRKLQDPEEGGAIPAQRELFLPDGDLVQLENVLQRIDEL